MPPALARFLRVSGISAAVAFVYGLARSARRPAPPEPAGTASWPPLVPEPAPEPRSGPVTFAEPAEPVKPLEATEPADATEATEAPEPEADGSGSVADGAGQSWVEPVDGECPGSHPIKGNADSMIFHVPGGMSYERTQAERCYCTAADAEADGFRQAKR